MQKLVAVCALFAVVVVVCSVDTEEPVSILRSESSVSDDGSYSFLYESANGSFREEAGAIVNPGAEDQSIKVTGSYKYIDANGEEVSVQYTADENGFVPIGSNIPKVISDAAAAAKDLPKEDADHSKEP